MTNLEQAARQALEALEESWHLIPKPDYARLAITDLQAALDQPANWQEIDCPCCGDMARAFPPAPKREWVGLTDEEIQQGLKKSWVTEQAFESAVWWAERKLKEKNT